MQRRVLLVALLCFAIAAALLVVFFPLKLKMLCWDGCPQNGMIYLLYRRSYPLAECYANHEVAVFSDPWERDYVGCSPLHDPFTSYEHLPSWLASFFG